MESGYLGVTPSQLPHQGRCPTFVSLSAAPSVWKENRPPLGVSPQST